MWMLRGNRYRIYPTKEQKVLMDKHFGSSRFIYNKLLEIKQLFYKKYRINISGFDLKRHVVILKEVYPWLKEVNSQSIQQACINLDKAFKNFFNFGFGYPKRKCKKDHHFSFHVPQHYQLDLSTSKLLLPKLGCIKVKCIEIFFKEI